MNEKLHFLRRVYLNPLLFISLFKLPANSQSPSGSKVITGTVKDQVGAPLPGATVNIKGKAVATSTDASGHFRMNVPDKTKAVTVSYVGMESLDVNIEDK